MIKTTKVVSGYAFSDVDLESVAVLTEVCTGGGDADGYPNSETIGIAKDDCGCLVLYRGSIDGSASEQSALFMSADGKRISQVLRELADAYDMVG